MQAGAAGELAAHVGEEPGPPGTGPGGAGAWRWPGGSRRALCSAETPRDAASRAERGRGVPKVPADGYWCEVASCLGTGLCGLCRGH